MAGSSRHTWRACERCGAGECKPAVAVTYDDAAGCSAVAGTAAAAAAAMVCDAIVLTEHGPISRQSDRRHRHNGEQREEEKTHRGGTMQTNSGAAVTKNPRQRRRACRSISHAAGVQIENGHSDRSRDDGKLKRIRERDSNAVDVGLQ